MKKHGADIDSTIKYCPLCNSPIVDGLCRNCGVAGIYNKDQPDDNKNKPKKRKEGKKNEKQDS